MFIIINCERYCFINQPKYYLQMELTFLLFILQFYIIFKLIEGKIDLTISDLEFHSWVYYTNYQLQERYMYNQSTCKCIGL